MPCHHVGLLSARDSLLLRFPTAPGIIASDCQFVTVNQNPPPPPLHT